MYSYFVQNDIGWFGGCMVGNGFWASHIPRLLFTFRDLALLCVSACVTSTWS